MTEQKSNPDIDWSKSHCGVHQSSYEEMLVLMPELLPIIREFPMNPFQYTWDVKVHMLMPGQFPCIPNWHFDMVPRGEDGKVMLDKRVGDTMWLWLSGSPLTEFNGSRNESYLISPLKWSPFTQYDQHRGTMANSFGWRCFIRAVPFSILTPKKGDKLRRHSQVYLDAENFKW